ncbi:hypothetical protein [Aeromonas caviae]
MNNSKLRSAIINNTLTNVLNADFAVHIASAKRDFKFTDKVTCEEFEAFVYAPEAITFQHNVYDIQTKRATSKNPFWDCVHGDIADVMKALEIKVAAGEKRKDQPIYRTIKRNLEKHGLKNREFNFAISQDKRVTTVMIADVNCEKVEGSKFNISIDITVMFYDAKHGISTYQSTIGKSYQFAKGKRNMSHVIELVKAKETRGGARKVKSVVTEETTLVENNKATAEVIEVVNDNAETLDIVIEAVVEQADALKTAQKEIEELKRQIAALTMGASIQKIEELDQITIQ